MWKVHLSRWVNRRLLGGKPDQMLSSRAYCEHWPQVERLINALIFWHHQHCKQSFWWEKNQQKGGK